MSEKSGRTVVRSKIPRFQGSRKTSTKTESLKNPRKDELTQRENITNKPRHLINTSDADNIEKPSNDGDDPFEPDPQALDSILSNKGINFGAIRASEMTPSVPVNRLSMWESLNEFKENLRKYKDSFQHLNGNMKTDQKPQTPTGNPKKSAALTPRSGRTFPEPAQMSLTQSYEQHKENLKIFRETMQNIDSALLTSRPAGNNPYGEFTPKQRQSGLTNTPRATMSATPVNHHVRRAWTELKENRPPLVGTNRPAAFSTYKIKPSKLCAIDEVSADICCTSKEEDECCSVRPVRRALLLSSDGNGATEKHSSFNGYDKASKEYCKSVESNQPAAVSSSVKDHLIQHSLYSNCGSESSEGLPATSGLLFKSPDIIQVSRIIPVFLAPKSPFPSVGNAVSSTECTWSCQQALCTPRPTTSERVHEAARNFHKIHNAQTFSKCTEDSAKLLSSNTQAVTSMMSAAEFLHTYRTSQDAKTALHSPLSAAGELNHYFNQLHLNTGPTLSTAISSQSSVSVPKLWQGATPPVLKTSISSTPVRAFHGKTVMSDTSSLFTNCPKLTVTPQSQVWREFVRDQRSPATSLSLSSQSARRNEGVASCLKNRALSRLDNTGGLSVRYAVSSVKKLRWADTQDCVEHNEGTMPESIVLDSPVDFATRCFYN